MQPGAGRVVVWVAWGAAVALGSTPLSAQDGTLSLGRAMAVARAASLQVARARASAQGLAAALDGFPRLDDPSFELRTENWGTASSAAGVLTDTFVVASQPLPLGGRRRAARNVLAAEHSAAQQAVAPTELGIALEVSRRYIDAVFARDLLAELGSHHDALSELARVVESRVAAGAAAAADGARLRAELIRIRQLRSLAQADLTRRLTSLQASLGTDVPIDPERLVTPVLTPMPAEPGPDLVATLVGRHPAVVDARARLEVARRNVDFEQALGRLHTSALGGYKRTAGISTGVAAIVFTVPLFDGNRAARARAGGNVQQAEFSATEAERVARAEMTALVDIAGELTRAHAETSAFDSIDIVRAAARARLRESSGEVLGVVDAERLWLDTRRDHRALERDALQALYELRIRLGLEIQP